MCVGKANVSRVGGSGMGLGARLIHRALVDDLAVVHVQLAWVDGFPTGNGSHMEVLDTV